MEESFAEMLQQAGYQTAMVGKWQGRDSALDRGFDRFFVGDVNVGENHFVTKFSHRSRACIGIHVKNSGSCA